MYVCKQVCFITRLWRPGDVTDSDDIAKRGGNKFSRLASKRDDKMKAEIAELVPEVAERDASRLQPITNAELCKSKNPPIVGLPEA
jgi:hypothetical protein